MGVLARWEQGPGVAANGALTRLIKFNAVSRATHTHTYLLGRITNLRLWHCVLAFPSYRWPSATPPFGPHRTTVRLAALHSYPPHKSLKTSHFLLCYTKKKHPLWITYRHLKDLCLLRSLDTFECRMLKKWTTCFNRRMLAFFPGCCQRMLIALNGFISLTHWNPDSQDIRVVSLLVACSASLIKRQFL